VNLLSMLPSITGPPRLLAQSGKLLVRVSDPVK
jgi:hypothetical protein